jgi:hypothetical protein
MSGRYAQNLGAVGRRREVLQLGLRPPPELAALGPMLAELVLDDLQGGVGSGPVDFTATVEHQVDQLHCAGGCRAFLCCCERLLEVNALDMRKAFGFDGTIEAQPSANIAKSS